MNCYKDRTYCSHSSQCSNVACTKRFTDEDNARATRAGMPVAFAALQLTCGKWKPVDGRAKLPAGLSEAERGLAP